MGDRDHQPPQAAPRGRATLSARRRRWLGCLAALAALWGAAGAVLLGRVAARDERRLTEIAAAAERLLAEAHAALAREAGWLAQDPAVVEAVRRGDPGPLVRGASAPLLALATARPADLLLVVDAAGLPLVELPNALAGAAAELLTPGARAPRVGVVGGHAYLLAHAPVVDAGVGPTGAAVVGRRLERVAAAVAALPGRAALAAIAGDRLLAATWPGLPTDGWAAAARAGAREVAGETWRLRPLAAEAGLWVLVPTDGAARRRLWLGLLGSFGLVAALTGGFGWHTGRRRPASPPGAGGVEPFVAIARLVESGRDPGYVLDAALEVVAAAAGTPAAALFRLDPPATLVAVVMRGLASPRPELARPWALETSGMARALRDGRLTLVRATPAEGALGALARATGHRAALVVPVPVGEAAWGAVALLTAEARAPDPERARYLEALGRQLGLAAGRLVLAREAQEKRRRLEGLARLTRTLTATLSPEDVLQRIVDAAVELFGCSVSRLWLVEEDGQHLALRASSGLRSQVEGVRRLRVGEGLAGTVAASRAPLAITDVLADPRTRNLEWMRAEGTVSFAGVPLLVGDRLLGALWIASRERHQHTAEELALLATLGDHAAIAIDNARLFAEEQARRRYLAALLEINKKIGAAGTTEELLTAIAQEAADLIGVDHAAFRLLEGDELVLAAAVGTAREAGFRPRLKVGESFVGRVVAEGRVITGPVERVPQVIPEHRAIDAAQGYVAYLGVPLRVGTRTLGALTFRARRLFTARDQEIAEAFADQAAIAVEQARLRRAAARHAERMRALADVERLLSSTLDPEGVARRVVENVCALLEAESSALYRFEPDTGRFVLVLTARQGADAFYFAPVLEPGTGLLALALRAGGPEATPDSVADPRLNLRPELRARLEAAPQRALLAVPLVVQDRVLGGLVVGGRTGRVFTEEEGRIAQAFADQAAVALENARLHEETERRRQEAEVIAEVAATLNASLDLDTVLQRVVEGARELCRGDTARIALREPGTDRYAIRYAVGLTPGVELPVVEPGRGSGGLVLTTGRPFRTDNYVEDPRITRDYVSHARALGHVAELVVPIAIDGRVEGLLYVDNRTARPFTDADEAVLVRMADHAAIAIRNARLYAEAREAAERLRALDAINRSVSASLELDRVLTTIATALAHLFDAAWVSIWELDPARGRLRRSTTAGEGIEVDLPEELALGEGGVGWVALHREPILWADIERDPRIIASPAFVRQGLRAVTVYPIMLGERVLGVFALNRREPAPVTPETVSILASVAAQAAIAIDHARLYGEAQERLRETTTLLEVSRVLSSTLDPEALLRELLRLVASALEADAVAIGTVDATGTLGALTGYHIPPERREATRALRLALAAEPFYAEAARTGRPVVTADAEADPRVPAAVRAALPHRSQLFAPITVKERVVGGIFAFWWARARRFTARELALVEALASQAGVALEHARLFQEHRRRVEELSVLHRLSRAVTGQLDRDALLEALRAEVPRVLAADRLVVFLLDDATGELEVALRVERGAVDTSGPRRYSRSLGLVAAVLESRRPVRTEDYVAECARRGVPAPPLEGPPCWLGAPMIAGDEVLGVLALSREGPPYSATDEQLLANIADLAALALRSARLYAERTGALAELEAAQDQLVRTEKLRALGEMASGVAHDFNNLLAAILGRTQLLLQHVQDPRLRQWLQVIERSATDGAQTVRRLQDFARVRRDAPRVPVDLAEVVRDALEITRSRWREESLRRGVVIDVRTQLAPVPRVAGDPVELREALTNIILNAVDAMPQGGTLTVTTAVGADGVEVAVSDTGVGIPENIRHRIFDPFFTTKGPQGTGLGLAMTYGIASRHGARIAVESAEGRGTTFRLVFPPLAEPVAPSEPEAPPAAAPARLRCLVVDDEEAVGLVIGDVLETAGHEPVVLTDGARAIERFRAEPFDLVFTDLAMPGVSGWQVARAVKSVAPDVPVVVVTGFGVELSADERRAHGVDEVLAKPIKIDDILGAVARAARRRAPASPPGDGPGGATPGPSAGGTA